MTTAFRRPPANADEIAGLEIAVEVLNDTTVADGRNDRIGNTFRALRHSSQRRVRAAPDQSTTIQAIVRNSAGGVHV